MSEQAKETQSTTTDMMIKATELQAGDRVTREDGSIATITSVTNGMYIGHFHLAFKKGDWAEIPRKSRIGILDRKKDAPTKGKK